MHTNIRSKYLVEQAHYFSTSYYMLLLQQTEITAISIEKGTSSRPEIYLWDAIINIRASERNPREFTLEVLTEKADVQRLRSMDLSKRQAVMSGKAQNLFNPEPKVFQCNERNKLVSELKHILHLKIFGETPIFEQNCRFRPGFEQHEDTHQSRESLMPDATVRLFPTAISVAVKQQEVGLQDEKLTREFQEAGVLAEPKSELSETLPFDKTDAGETRLQMEEYQFASFNPRLQLDDEDQSSEPFMSQAEHSEVFQGRGMSCELGNQQVSTAAKFAHKANQNKNKVTQGLSLLEEQHAESDLEENKFGECGEESILNCIVGKHQDAVKPRHFFVYLCDLHNTLVAENTISFLGNNQEAFTLQFDSAKQTKASLKKLEETHNQELLTPFQKEQLADQTIFSAEEPRQPSLIMDILSCQIDGSFETSRFELDENWLVEINCKTDSVKRKCMLVDLDTMRIIDKSKKVNLVLRFEPSFQTERLNVSHFENVTIALHFDNFETRERFVSCLLTMRNLSQAQYAIKVDSLKIFQDESLDQMQKIIGYCALECGTGKFNKQVTHDYENNLLNKLSGEVQTKQKDLRLLDSTIEEILMNATFSNLQSHASLPGQIKHILNDFERILQDYFKIESQKPGLVEKTVQRNYLKPLNPVRLLGVDSQQEKVLDKLNEQLGETDGQQTLFELQSRLILYLNLVRTLVNSKYFFTEFAFHPQVLELLTQLLVSRNSVIALLSSVVLKACIQHAGDSDYQTELANKRALVFGYLPTQASIQRPKGKENTKDKFFDRVIFYLMSFAKGYDTARLAKATVCLPQLNLHSVTQVLQAVLQTRKTFFYQTAEAEEFIAAFTQRMVSMEGADDERRTNMPLFHVIDKFCLIGSDRVDSFTELKTDGYCDVRLSFSRLLAASLQYCYNRFSPSQLQNVQDYMLKYSVQIIWHIYQQAHSHLAQQKQLSCQIISYMLHANRESIGLVCRLFPQSVIAKTTKKELVEPLTGKIHTTWTADDWKQFFTVVEPKLNEDNALEQWNDQTRAELADKLEAEVKRFMVIQADNEQAISDELSKQLVLPCHQFGQLNRVTSNQTNLRWNYLEFSVTYSCLQPFFRVGKYFLRKLLVLGDPQVLDVRTRPAFDSKVRIGEPVVFLEELVSRFIASKDPEEHEVILMTLCVLYRNQFGRIGSLKSLPFWLKLVNLNKNANCHFLILQLVHISLSIEQEDTARKNLKKFTKIEGFQILLQCMNRVFQDLEMPNQRFQRTQSNPLKRMGLWKPATHSISKQVQMTNFTSSATNSRYFAKNKPNASMSILCLKILDLIFSAIPFNDHVPLPANRKFIYEKTSMATLTAMLILENSDLTREVLIFIEKHLNTHYAFFNLKQTGIIELLMLCLSTRNGERALALLLKFQEVSIEFNEGLKLALFNKNDLKMIQEDKSRTWKQKGKQFEFFDHQDTSQAKRVPILNDSIFLRYLPVPFIKYLYEERQPPFLEVYRMKQFRRPILIWSQDMRQYLEQKIRDNASRYQEELYNFAHREGSLPPLQIMEEAARFSQIEDETRCGRYYLSVWVEPRETFAIPENEEEEFHNKMQTELRQQLNEDKLDKQKVLILLKSCLQALQTFKKKRILALNEIKRILDRLQKDDEENNGKQTTNYDRKKQIIYIAMQVVLLALQKDHDNANEIAKMNGVEFVTEVMKYTLSKVKQTTQPQWQEESKLTMIKEKDNEDSRYNEDSSFKRTTHKIKEEDASPIDQDEASTLHLCILAIKELVKEDIQAFFDLTLEQRVSIFESMTKILSLSFSFYHGFKQRKLKDYGGPFDQSRNGSHHKHAITFGGTRDLGHNLQNQRLRTVKKRKSKKEKPRLEAEQGEDGENTLTLKKNKSLMKGKQPEEMQFEQDRDDEEGNLVSRENNQWESQRSLSKLIFNITRTVFSFAREIALYPMLHPDLIGSGLVWQALQHVFFALVEDKYYEELQLKPILKESALVLKQLISFAVKFATQGAESFQFKTLVQDQEKEILGTFNQCVQNLFTAKFQEKLVAKFTVNSDNKMEFADLSTTGFFNLFSANNIQQPELVWNNETRHELLTGLQAQLLARADINSNWDHKAYLTDIANFSYSVNDKELRIQNIFVKYFNLAVQRNEHSDMFSREKKQSFAEEIIRLLGDLCKHDEPVAKENHEKVEELAKAFHNLVESLRYEVPDRELSTLFKLIRVHKTESNQRDEEFYRRISKLVFSIVRFIVEQQNNFDSMQTPQKHKSEFEIAHEKTMCHHLLQNDDFFKLMVRVLYKEEMQMVEFDGQFMDLLDTLLKMKHESVSSLFVDRHLVMFLLNIIFEGKAKSLIQKETRAHLIGCVLKIQKIDRDLSMRTQRSHSGILQGFIPPNFFAEINDLMRRPQPPPELYERQAQFLDDFDSPVFENVFVKWNQNLKEESHNQIVDICDRVYNNEQLTVPLRKIEELESYEIGKEQVIKQVILRLYNCNPAVFINQRLTTFVTDLSEEIYQLSKELYDLKNQANSFEITQEIQPEEDRKTQHLKTQYQFTCYKALVLLSALLLSLEQLLTNDFNPNLQQIRRNPNSQGLEKFNEIQIDTMQQSKVIEDSVFKLFKVWLQSPVFLETGNKAISITFLQVLHLVVELDNSYSFYKQDWPLQFISDTFSRLADERPADAQQQCENKLTLMIAHSLIKACVHPIEQFRYLHDSLFNEKTLQQLLKLRETGVGTNLHDHAWFLLAHLRVQQLNESGISDQLQRQRKDISQDQVYLKYKNLDVKEKWRHRPGSVSDAKMHYDSLKVFNIEKLTIEQQVLQDIFKFPVLSEVSVKPIDEDLYNSQLLKESSDISQQESDLTQEDKSQTSEETN